MTPLLQTVHATAGSKAAAVARVHAPAYEPRARGLGALRAGLLIAPLGLAMWAGILWLLFG
jgi:hypothetical protein